MDILERDFSPDELPFGREWRVLEPEPALALEPVVEPRPPEAAMAFMRKVAMAPLGLNNNPRFPWAQSDGEGHCEVTNGSVLYRIPHEYLGREPGVWEFGDGAKFIEPDDAKGLFPDTSELWEEAHNPLSSVRVVVRPKFLWALVKGSARSADLRRWVDFDLSGDGRVGITLVDGQQGCCRFGAVESFDAQAWAKHPELADTVVRLSAYLVRQSLDIFVPEQPIQFRFSGSFQPVHVSQSGYVEGLIMPIRRP